MEEVTLKVPSMGDSITTGTVGSVNKAEGNLFRTLILERFTTIWR